MSILKHLIDRPIGVLMSTVAVIIISIVFIRDIAISLLPDIPIPYLTIQIDAPDSDARTLENTITRVVRNQLLQVSHLRDIQSHTRNGSSIIQLTLEYGVDTRLSYIEVNEKIDLIMNYLPRDLARPRVVQSNISDIPVFYLNMRSLDPQLTPHLELSKFASNVIKRRLEQLEEIAYVDMHGYTQPEVIIRPKSDILSALNASDQDLITAIQESNIELGNVLIQDGLYEYHLRLNNRITSADQLPGIPVRIQDKIYQLSQLAEVLPTEKKRRGSFWINNHRGISLAVRKKASASNFALQEHVQELLASFEEDYPDVAFSISNDQSSILRSSFDSLKTSLYYGIGFASIVLFFFFRDWRLPLLMIIVIPISLLLSLLGFYLLDMSINIVSLTGLILGIGLMIDNSIIITENIKRYAVDHDLKTGSHLGANEVIRPLMSSALTTCSVFLPLILLSGLAGALFYDQALSITISLSSSLLVAYFVLPVLAPLILQKQHPRPEHSDGRTHGHLWLINQILRWRGLIGLLFIGLLILTYYSFVSIPKQSFPQITRYAYNLHIDWNQAISLEESEKRSQALLKGSNLHIRESNVYLGEWQYLLIEEDQNINELELVLYFDKNPSAEELTTLEAAIHDQYPLAILKVSPLENVFDRIFGQSEVQLYAHVQHNQLLALPDPQEFEPIIYQLNKAGIKQTMPPLDRYIELRIDHQKLLLYRVDFDQLLYQLKAVFRANVISQIKSTDEFIPIQIAYDEERDIADILRYQMIRTKDGDQLPMSTFVTLSPRQYYKSISAGRGGERISLPMSSYDKEDIATIDRIMGDHPNFTVQYDGPYIETQKTMRQLTVIGFLVLALLFLILAAQFESFVQPLIVAFTLPMGSLGALVALHWMGENLNIMSVVGIIILSGIDVNDAILKVDIFNKYRAKGYTLRDAILVGSERRLRPIVMTSLTTILAMLPILYSTGLGAELQRPLAIALIGGLVCGTVASIVLIPVFYYSIYILGGANRSTANEVYMTQQP